MIFLVFVFSQGLVCVGYVWFRLVEVLVFVFVLLVLCIGVWAGFFFWVFMVVCVWGFGLIVCCFCGFFSLFWFVSVFRRSFVGKGLNGV